MQKASAHETECRAARCRMTHLHRLCTSGAVYPASFTIEAALSLTFFIFACVILTIPMLILNQHRNAGTILEENARLVSKTKYVEYYRNKYTSLKIDSDLLHGLETGLSAAVLSFKVRQPGMKNIDLWTDSYIDETTVSYVLNYDAMLPFSVLGLHSLPQQVVAQRRAWIGADGWRWDDSKDGTAAADPLVYISSIDPESNVYHSTAGCTYLSHIFLTSSGSAVQGAPTAYPGVRYTPCAVCQPDHSTPVVYYTAGGKNYHRTRDCTSLRSYIQAVSLSRAKAAGRHACSRCG